MEKRLSTLLLGCVALIGGCGASSGQNQSAAAAAQPGPAAEPAAAPPVGTSAAGAALPQLTPQWLAGRWHTGGGTCGPGESFFDFAADGRYSLGPEQGRWTLAGSALTIEVTQAPDGGVTAGDRHTSELAVIGQDEAELRNPNVDPVRLLRCP